VGNDESGIGGSMNADGFGLRVLVVEDEGLVAMLLEDMLADLGHEVVAIAARMDRAAELVSTANVDIAILDMNLNGEHTAPLGSTLAARGVPFIFATGYGRESLPEPLRGATIIQKPFQQGTLDRALRTAMAR
jgi:CheY-like chemotaxis protein